MLCRKDQALYSVCGVNKAQPQLCRESVGNQQNVGRPLRPAGSD